MKDFSKQIEAISQRLDQLESLSAEMLDRENTAVFIVDMIGGFAKKGALYSPPDRSNVPFAGSFPLRHTNNSFLSFKIKATVAALELK